MNDSNNCSGRLKPVQQKNKTKLSLKSGLMPKDERRGKKRAGGGRQEAEKKLLSKTSILDAGRDADVSRKGVYIKVNDCLRNGCNKNMRQKTRFSARYQARRYAMQALYQWSFSKTPWLALSEQFLTANETHLRTDIDYFTELVRGILEKIDSIDEAIKLHIDRPFENLNPVELAVLRLSFYELLFQKDVPPKVVLNEAIELTKSFGSVEGYKYVNGVLDSFVFKGKN